MSALPITVRAVRDRWVGMVVAVVSIGAMLTLGMLAYAEVGIDEVYGALPEAMRAVMGIPLGAGPAALAYNVMLGTIGSLTLAGLAVSIGASTFAGEERNGTIGLLLANPHSRTRVLVAKLVALVALVALAGAALWGVSLLAPVVVDVEIGETHLAAMAVHLTANALFHGFLALAIGAWSGRRGLASGVGALVVTLSFFLSGLLPLVDATEPVVEFLPWHWFDGGAPLVNGVVWADLAALLSGVLLFAGMAVVGVRRRDLRGREAGQSLLDRLRAHPMTTRFTERLAGSARVSSIAARTAADHQGILAIVAGSMFGFMGVMLGPMYGLVQEDMAALSDNFPPEMLAIVGGGDMGTPEGWYQTESLGLMAPIAVILVAVVVGARAVAGEEHATTMGLLLANPITRARVLAEKTVVMLAYVAVVGAATAAGIATGSILGGLGMDLGNVAAAGLMATLLGWAFGGLALFLGAATGQVRVASLGTVAAAVVAYVVDAFGAINPGWRSLERLSPFDRYMGGEPLLNGVPWGDAAVLVVVAAVLIGAAFPAFERRDLRQR